MKQLKRTIRLCGALLCALFVLVSCTRQLPAQSSAAPGVRMKWEDFVQGPEGAKRLASLKKAILVMKALDNSPKDSVNYRRSWAYWANIHGYYGSESPDGTVAQQIAYLKSIGYDQYIKYYAGITDQTPPDSVAQTVWATCQHGEPNFFLWHRMYLYYFEQVLQWAAGDPTLRLPYWNYTDPTQLALPAEFRQLNSVLYDDKRDPDINNGSETLDAKRTDIDRAMKISNYLDYQTAIENGVHGYVHCTVGPTCPVAHMGDVPVAGNDPIFYHHHANIDRLFACWETKYGIPSGSWSTQQFSFPDATGTLQTQPVSNFLDTTALGYIYDNESDCTRTPAAAPRLLAAAVPQEVSPTAIETNGTVLASAKSISVDKATTSVAISAPATNLLGLPAAPSGPVYLVLRDITAQSPPGTLLDVYIAKKGQPQSKLYAGTISWFNDFSIGHHHHSGPLDKTLEFDVTDQLKKLGITGAAGLTVSIEATSGRALAKGVATAHEATVFRPQAHVQIGSIELRQGTAAQSK